MNQEYLNRVENLKKDFEQFAEKDVTVKIEIDSVSCTVNPKQITIEIADKELEKIINETIRLASLEYSKRRQSAMNTLNKRVIEITQPFKEIAKDLDNIQ